MVQGGFRQFGHQPGFKKVTWLASTASDRKSAKIQHDIS